VVIAATASGFVPSSTLRSSNNALSPTRANPLFARTPEVDGVGNNLQVKSLLQQVQDMGLLKKVASSGLLSNAQDAGVTLSSLQPFLELAADNPELLVLAEASGPDILPILPKLVEFVPFTLPLLASAIKIPPIFLQAAGVASAGAAAAAVVLIPDDTIVAVAIQTLAVAVLGVVVPVASIGGGIVLGTLTGKK